MNKNEQTAAHNTPPPITRAGFDAGVRACMSFYPTIAVFAMAYGALAQKAGMGLIEALSISAFVYAGGSQLIALAAWQSEWTLTGALVVIILVASVNARLILMGATLRPWFAPLGPAKAYGILTTNTDLSWILSMRYHEGGGRDIGFYLGTALPLWAVWLVATAPGWWLGALVSDPKTYGLDLMVPIFFATNLVSVWKGPKPARPWLVACIVAVAVRWLVPGYLYVVAGALAGAVAGALLDDE